LTKFIFNGNKVEGITLHNRTEAQLNLLKRCLQRLRKLSWKMNLLLFVSFFLMGLVRCSIIIVPFKYLSPLLGENNSSTSTEVKHDVLKRAAKIGWCIEKMSRFTPWESKCLVTAMTAQILLRVIGIPSTLYLGMAKDTSNQLIAHAWLRCGNLILTGASVHKDFKMVAQFASLLHKENCEIIDRG
jgi:hypothetical protein